MVYRILTYFVSTLLVTFCSGLLDPDKTGNGNDANKPTITLNHATCDTIPCSGGKVIIEFETSHDWAIATRHPGANPATDWYAVEGTAGNKGKGKVTVTIYENKNTTQRTMAIVIYATSEASQSEASVDIVQLPYQEQPNDQNPDTNPDDNQDNPDDNPDDNPENPDDNPDDNPDNPGDNNPDNPGDNTGDNTDDNPDNPNTDQGPVTGTTDGHEWVNLGLPSGTLWATMNIGATSPEEYGRYVAWGETVTIGEEDKDNEYNYLHYETYVKKNYSSYSYKFFHVEDYKEGDNIWEASHTNVLHKYYKDDALTTLEPSDDEATAKWGTRWAMPTYAQALELVQYTKYQWTDNYNGTGIAGGIFYRKKSDANSSNTASYTTDDTHIFIPASGYAEWEKFNDAGDYAVLWTKSLQDAKVSTNPYYTVWSLFFSSNDAEPRSAGRTYGYTVRAVVK